VRTSVRSFWFSSIILRIAQSNILKFSLVIGNYKRQLKIDFGDFHFCSSRVIVLDLAKNALFSISVVYFEYRSM